MFDHHLAHRPGGFQFFHNHHIRAEFLRRKVFQLAAITSERRACAANDRNVTWLEHEFRQNGAAACSELVSLAAYEELRQRTGTR